MALEGSRVAGGTIAPSRFVKNDTTLGRVVAATTTTEVLVGISAPWTRRAASIDGTSITAAAISGEPIMLYTAPEASYVKLELGGTVTFGDFLTSGSGGVGVATTSSSAWVGAQAQESGVSGDIIDVLVITPRLY